MKFHWKVKDPGGPGDDFSVVAPPSSLAPEAKPSITSPEAYVASPAGTDVADPPVIYFAPGGSGGRLRPFVGGHTGGHREEHFRCPRAPATESGARGSEFFGCVARGSPRGPSLDTDRTWWTDQARAGALSRCSAKAAASRQGRSLTQEPRRRCIRCSATPEHLGATEV